MLSAIAFVNTKTTTCSAYSLGQAQYLPFHGGRYRPQASAPEQFGGEGGGLFRERGRKNQIPPRQRLFGLGAEPHRLCVLRPPLGAQPVVIHGRDVTRGSGEHLAHARLGRSIGGRRRAQIARAGGRRRGRWRRGGRRGPRSRLRDRSCGLSRRRGYHRRRLGLRSNRGNRQRLNRREHPLRRHGHPQGWPIWHRLGTRLRAAARTEREHDPHTHTPPPNARNAPPTQPRVTAPLALGRQETTPIQGLEHGHGLYIYASFARGSSIRKVVPRPGVDCASISPSCIWTIR